MISGTLHSLSFAFVGVFAGQALEKYNRVRILAVAIFIWNATNFVSGTVNGLALMALMRFVLGAAISVAEPAMFSIAADYFPKRLISTANAVIVSGGYMGAAFGSMCIMLCGKIGWKNLFTFTGLGGIVLAALFGLLVREPKRGQFSEEEDKIEEVDDDQEKLSLLGNFKKSLVDCMTNKVTRYATIGAMFRFWGMFATDFYLPAFYLKCFPQFTN